MTKATTALGSALESKGVLRRNVELQMAIAKYQNQGGEFGVAYAMLCAAFGRGDGPSPPASGPVAGAAASRGVGRAPSTDKVGRLTPTPRPPRGAAAIASVQPTLAKSLFNTILLPDGRRLGDVRWSECPALASRYQTLARVLLACRNFAIPADPATTLDAIVPENELRVIVTASERFNAID